MSKQDITERLLLMSNQLPVAQRDLIVEAVKEIDRLRSGPPLPSSIQEALNSGDGVYRP